MGEGKAVTGQREGDGKGENSGGRGEGKAVDGQGGAGGSDDTVGSLDSRKMEEGMEEGRGRNRSQRGGEQEGSCFLGIKIYFCWVMIQAG